MIEYYASTIDNPALWSIECDDDDGDAQAVIYSRSQPEHAWVSHHKDTLAECRIYLGLRDLVLRQVTVGQEEVADG